MSICILYALLLQTHRWHSFSLFFSLIFVFTQASSTSTTTTSNDSDNVERNDATITSTTTTSDTTIIYTSMQKMTMATQTTDTLQSDSIRILRSPHCNRAENMSQTCKKHLALAQQRKSTPMPTSTSSSASGKSKMKKFTTKVRHKAPHIEQDDSITPLFVSNILDKL